MLLRSTLKAKLKHPRNSGDKKWGTVSSGSFGLKIGSRRRMPERIFMLQCGFSCKRTTETHLSHNLERKTHLSNKNSQNFLEFQRTTKGHEPFHLQSIPF